MNQQQLPNFKTITKMYEKLTYFDQYGGSVILFIIITIIISLGISYCFIMINTQPIIDDWPNQRCKPQIIPFAGMITHPEDVTASEYTIENFNYCTQDILKNISGLALQPLTFVTNILQNVSKAIEASIQQIRAMFDKVRSSIQAVSEQIMSRLINVMIPLQQIIISFKDVMGKIQGAMTGGLFTLLGSYYTLKSLMGAIAQFIIIILIALAAMIAIFWILPFTWGAAAANTVIFIAIAIPMAIILAFMTDVLKVQTSLSIPSVKCFDKNTIIKMNDGSEKKISQIKNGEILLNNNKVTGIIKVETKGSIMYHLNNIYVSDSHKIIFNNKWICVSEHPNAIKCNNYIEPYLYCLNTSNKNIYIKDMVFSDWDEIDKNDIFEIMQSPFVQLNNITDIHRKIDSGFEGYTKICLKNGSVKNIKDVSIGDILINGEKVYGIVEIDGKNINQQFKFILGKNLLIEGGPNLVICDSKISFLTTLELSNRSESNNQNKKIQLLKNHDKLYHLLTDKKCFTIGDISFYDYNAAIDIFLEKNDQKLLSTKYV
jgi:hypothetical protein